MGFWVNIHMLFKKVSKYNKTYNPDKHSQNQHRKTETHTRYRDENYRRNNFLANLYLPSGEQRAVYRRTALALRHEVTSKEKTYEKAW